MAFHYITELGDELGLKKGYVTMYVKRGKLIADPETKMIDDRIPQNREWIQKMRLKLEAKQELEESKKKKRPQTLNKHVEKVDPKPDKIESGSLADLDRQKKIAEIEYKKEQTEKARLQTQKLRGESIPTKMVINVFGMMGHGFQTNYKNGAESLMMEIAQRTKMSEKNKAFFKGRLTELINESHKNAVRDTKNAFDSLIDEVSVENSIEDE